LAQANLVLSTRPLRGQRVSAMAALKSLFAACTGSISGLTSGGGGDVPMFIMLGLDGAGKTTLLYKLKIGRNWKDIDNEMREMRSDMKSENYDAGYHYEEFHGRPFTHGIWEVPGTEAMRNLWPCFYRAIKIHGVIFVVDSEDHYSEYWDRIETAKQELHYLMNEDDLRLAAFAVVINQKKSTKTKKGAPQGKVDKKGSQNVYDGEKHELLYLLGLHKLHPSVHWRTKCFILDVLSVEGSSSSGGWKGVLGFMKEVLTNEKGHNMKL